MRRNKFALSLPIQPLAAPGATRSRLRVLSTIQVTVPPTLIVVTFVPLASSTHLKLDPFTDAVVGALGVVGEVVVVTDGVAVAVVVGVLGLVGAFVCLSAGVHEEMPTRHTVVKANPRTLNIVVSSFKTDHRSNSQNS